MRGSSPAVASSMNTATWQVGDVLVSRIDELALPADTGAWLLPEATPELIADSGPLPAASVDGDGRLALSVHTFALRIGERRVLVDTGVGNGKPRANPAWSDLDTSFLARLSAADFAPEDVDLVVTTHLHTDHVGWNTRWDGAAWTPTFPHAAHLVAREEYEWWTGQDLDAGRRQLFADSVEPVRASGQLRFLDVPSAGLEVAPGLELVRTPGHTPGHVAVRVTSGAATAMITGDCLHHPLQLARPDVSSSADVDPGQAVRSRRALLDELAESGGLLLGTHFPPPAAGTVAKEAGRYHFTLVHPGQR
jgi:glyoxylase-like metal-dependent hydrolase (beta-lactamase superfamily II)